MVWRLLSKASCNLKSQQALLQKPPMPQQRQRPLIPSLFPLQQSPEVVGMHRLVQEWITAW